ncbi:3-isopropylmalate dehydratase small subunit [Akkermansia massiliensis]
MSLTKFTSITGTCVPVPGPDMDTDRIIPSRFLKCITFDELAGVMFWDERFDENGQSKSHPVDDPRFKGASIILGGSNFGCGSSREHAPQTIKRSGVKAVIAESFAEIFFGNSTGIGLPCVCASADDIAALTRYISDHPETEVTIDLLNMAASWKEGSFPIRMPAEAREALSRGRWDSIAELLVNMDAVEKKNAELPQVTAPC